MGYSVKAFYLNYWPETGGVSYSRNYAHLLMSYNSTAMRLKK